MVTTPSPLVLINATPQVNGVDVDKNSTVTVALASSAGVYAWDVTCIGTDDDSTVAAVNATLAINHSNNTATFTSPDGYGRALIFQSTVNNGVDINGVVQASYVTTFGVYILSDPLQLRVGAQNETNEGDVTFGWLTKFNDIIRTTPFNTGSTITASGTWTSDVSGVIVVEGFGGGGGGAGGDANYTKGGGGGGAALVTTKVVTVVAGNTYDVTIGAGGAGGAGNTYGGISSHDGYDGSPTTFSYLGTVLAQFNGGGGGQGVVAATGKGGLGGLCLPEAINSNFSGSWDVTDSVFNPVMSIAAGAPSNDAGGAPWTKGGNNITGNFTPGTSGAVSGIFGTPHGGGGGGAGPNGNGANGGDGGTGAAGQNGSSASANSGAGGGGGGSTDGTPSFSGGNGGSGGSGKLTIKI